MAFDGIVTPSETTLLMLGMIAFPLFFLFKPGEVWLIRKEPFRTATVDLIADDSDRKRPDLEYDRPLNRLTLLLYIFLIPFIFSLPRWWGDGKDLLFLTSARITLCVHLCSNRLRENSRWMDAQPSNAWQRWRKDSNVLSIFSYPPSFLARTHSHCGLRVSAGTHFISGLSTGKTSPVFTTYSILLTFTSQEFVLWICFAPFFQRGGLLCAPHTNTENLKVSIEKKTRVFMHFNRVWQQDRDDFFFTRLYSYFCVCLISPPNLGRSKPIVKTLRPHSPRRNLFPTYIFFNTSLSLYINTIREEEACEKKTYIHQIEKGKSMKREIRLEYQMMAAVSCWLLSLWYVTRTMYSRNRSDSVALTKDVIPLL